jgi:hypothetical protein
VEFAKRHGVEVEPAVCDGHPRVMIGNIRVGRGPLLYYAATPGMSRLSDTIPEALARLAAATVDDEEAHLEVCGLVEGMWLANAFRERFPDAELSRGVDAVSFQRWWVDGGPQRKSPWLARKATIEQCRKRLEALEAHNA